MCPLGREGMQIYNDPHDGVEPLKEWCRVQRSIMVGQSSLGQTQIKFINSSVVGVSDVLRGGGHQRPSSKHWSWS